MPCATRARTPSTARAPSSRPWRSVEAGLAAAVLSGAPSTAVTLWRSEDLLEGVRAAGSIVVSPDAPGPLLLAAAVPVHLALSLGWAIVLERAIPPGRELLGGLLGGF